MITIAHISDIHCRKNIDKELVEHLDFIKDSFAPDLFCVSGDLTEYGTYKELQIAKALLDSLKTPYVVCVGNHDKTDWSTYPKRFNEVFNSSLDNPGLFVRSFHNKQIHVFALNSIGPFRRREFARGHISWKQLHWLEQDARGLHGVKIAMFHHNITHIPKPCLAKPFLRLSNSDRVMNTFFKDTVNIDLILHGHRHRLFNFFHYASSDFPRNIGILGCAWKSLKTSHIIKIVDKSLELYEVKGTEVKLITFIQGFFGKEKELWNLTEFQKKIM